MRALLSYTNTYRLFTFKICHKKKLISDLKCLKMANKQLCLAHRWDSNRYYHSVDLGVMAHTSHSLKLQYPPANVVLSHPKENSFFEKVITLREGKEHVYSLYICECKCKKHEISIYSHPGYMYKLVCVHMEEIEGERKKKKPQWLSFAIY